MRSVWKGSFIKNNLTLHKSSVVIASMLKKKVIVNDGKANKSIIIERNMIGLKVGEFIFSRKMGVLHKKKTLNKKGKKK